MVRPRSVSAAVARPRAGGRAGGDPGRARVRGAARLGAEPIRPRDLDRLLWGIGTWLGQGIIQNTPGTGSAGSWTTLKRTRAMIPTNPACAGTGRRRAAPHTDSCDIVGLLYVRRALSGGESSVVSATALYNAILREHPGLIDPLCRAFGSIRSARANADRSTAAHPGLQLFRREALRPLQQAADRARGQRSGHPLTPEQSEAVALVRSLSVDPSYGSIDLRGRHQLINNRTTFHARKPSRTVWTRTGSA